MKSFVPTARASLPTPWHGRLCLAALTLPLAAACLLGTVASAQTITSAVPGFITYQGKVLTSTGALVGAGTPVNRIVIFRVWGHQGNSTANDLLYSEQQTVTITDGEFSVLIGQGTAVSGTPLGYSEASKGPPTTKLDSVSVFSGASRYLGVTVDDGTATADPEISPRQQMVTSAFAFRAKYAESLGANGGSQLAITDQGNVGVGLTNPTFPLTFATTNGDKIGLSGGSNYAIGVQNNLVQIHGATSTDDIAFGHGTSASLTETVRFKGNGNVGIGTSTPLTRLDVNGVIGVFDGSTKSRNAGLQTENNGQIFNLGVNDSSSNRFGGAYTQADQGGFLRMDTRSGQNLFQFRGRAGAATTETEIVSITNTGNVGIGRTSPTVKLDVNGDIASSSISAAGSASVGWLRANGMTSTHAQGTWLEWNAASGLAYFLNQKNGLTGGMLFGEVTSGTTYTEHMRITSAGNVGIGTGSPVAPLSFANTIGQKVTLYGSSSSSSYGFGIQNALLQIHSDSSAADIAFGYGASTFFSETMRIKGNGNIGIATSNPTKGKIEINSFVNNSGLGANTAYNYGGTYNQGAASATSFSLYAMADIGARQFLAFSDARIKRAEGRSDAARDLAILRDIEVTDYTYIDTIAKGPGRHKKVIAQQVEKVFPQAVSRSTDEVPDIYRKATIKDGWVILATDLKQGERVRLIGGKQDGVFPVLEIAEGKFRTDFATDDGQVFVFGREVKDFRNVDYEAIAMLNVSTTQELIRQVDALRTANTVLTQRLAELEARDRARDTKLAAIEKLLSAGQTVMARPVSATGNGQE